MDGNVSRQHIRLPSVLQTFSRFLPDTNISRCYTNSQARHLDIRRESKNSRPASLSAVTTCEGNAILSSSSSLQSLSRRGPSRRSLHHHVRGRQHASRGLQWDVWNRFVAGRASCSVDDQVGDGTRSRSYKSDEELLFRRRTTGPLHLMPRRTHSDLLLQTQIQAFVCWRGRGRVSCKTG